MRTRSCRSRYNAPAGHAALVALLFTVALSSSALASTTRLHLGIVAHGGSARAAAAGPGGLSTEQTMWGGGPAAQVQANDATAHSAAGPFAHAANVNSVIPDFIFFFNYNVAGRTKLQLLEQVVQPYYPSFESETGVCIILCTGNGHFSSGTIQRGHKLAFKVVGGKLFMNRRTTFVKSVTAANEIGRFKVEGLRIPGFPVTPSTFTRASGCTPANLAVSDTELEHWQTQLPRVPCRPPPRRNDHVSVSAPFELSSTTPGQVRVSGHAANAQWLIVFVQASSQACRLNAFAEELRTGRHSFLEAKVHGSFSGTLGTATSSKPGLLCAYLQAGGRLQVTDGSVLPYGRVGATSAWAFSAGDSLTITGPSTATTNQQVNVVYAGQASLPEELYIFAPFAPCAATAQEEYQALGSSPSSVLIDPVSGPFSKAVTVTVAQSSNLCGYLQVGAPANGAPTGPTLVAATHPIFVTGPALDRSLRASRQAPTR